jgi:hypothetical protein
MVRRSLGWLLPAVIAKRGGAPGLETRFQVALRDTGDCNAIGMPKLDHRVAMGVGSDGGRQLLYGLNIGKVIELNNVMLRIEVGNGVGAESRAYIIKLGHHLGPVRWPEAIANDWAVIVLSDVALCVRYLNHKCLTNFGYSGAPIIAKIGNTASIVGINSVGAPEQRTGVGCSANQLAKAVAELTKTEEFRNR